uniref:Uncharacterized protein n=1 Tax=Gouania willdenowi TaxID=441366 RepID=A0A8C5EH18_GOUWI
MLLQGGHHHGSRCHCTRLYLEVTRVHLQFLRVQHAQLCICSLDVVHVLHSLLQGLHDHFSMSCYFGIGGDSSSIVEVSKAAKVPLSPGVHNQTPEHTHTHTQQTSVSPLLLPTCRWSYTF